MLHKKRLWKSLLRRKNGKEVFFLKKRKLIDRLLYDDNTIEHDITRILPDDAESLFADK